jgi:hypothetical protein
MCFQLFYYFKSKWDWENADKTIPSIYYTEPSEEIQYALFFSTSVIDKKGWIQVTNNFWLI